MISFASLLQFGKLFDELSPHLEDILPANHLGVAVALSESCQKLGVKQGKFKNVSHRIFSAIWEFTGPRSAVGNVSGIRCESDCRSRGCKFDPGPVPYFSGD